jgi:hypothetical protein
MRESVSNVNSTIKSLFDLNHKIRNASTPIKLHDLRDNLVNDLAKFMDLKITFEASGSVLVQSQKTGTILVSGEHYAKFNYTGILSESKLQNLAHYPPMTMTHYSSDGSYLEPIVFMGGQDDPTLEFSGGQWGGLVKLRREVLPNIIDTAKIVARNITKNVNDIHNNGSSFPPKTRFESTINTRASQTFNWKPFTIYTLNKDGDQLRDRTRLLNPITIDMSKVSSAQRDSVANVADMIKELNNALDQSPASSRVSIGAISNGAGVQINNEYLINNIQLKSKGAISGLNNSFSFELDLQGNSHFGSNIEVLGVSTSNGYNVPVDQLPNSFRLDKGKDSATGMPISVDGIDAPRSITIDIRITGDNGVVKRGAITYDITPSVKINDRIGINSLTANPQGDFVNPSPGNFTSIARAMLVDENGVEIDLNANPDAEGKLVIQTSDDAYRLAIQGSLGQIFEFNNMFNFDELTGKMEVNPSISSDISNFAIGRATKGAGADAVYTVGDTKASATLNFGGGAITHGDSVTIGGQVFTFAAAPANGNQVLTGGGVAALAAAINNHRDIGNIVTATVAGNILTLEAKNKGTGGNMIAVATNLAGGATIDLNGGGANAINVGNLQNATNKLETLKIYDHSIKSISGEVIEGLSNLQFSNVPVKGGGLIPDTELSLSNLATIFTGLLTDKLDIAETNSSVASNVMEQMHRVLQDKFGIKRDEQLVRLIEDGKLLQAQAHLLSMINNIDTKVQDTIFG